MMDVQIDFFGTLDRESDTRKPNLCRTWENAIMNEHGVFIDNRIDIDVYKSKSKCYPRITIHCALEYLRSHNRQELAHELAYGNIVHDEKWDGKIKETDNGND